MADALPYDPRITPARGDIAAAHLEGVTPAERYVTGAAYQVTAGVAAIRRAAVGDGEMISQALHGETLTLYDEVDGWGWGQLSMDGYVGYVEMDALSAPVLPVTHRVTALRTYVFSKPDLKSAPRFMISRNALLVAEGQADNGFVPAARAGWVWAGHLSAPDAAAPDWVAVAESYAGAPYLWGGRESLGLDCSGLIQAALHAVGRDCPRDADMQEAALGAPVPVTPDFSGLRRGDLVFWRGHVGVMVDGDTMLHANAHHMATATEPLAQAAARIQTVAGPVTCITRLRP